MTSQTWLALVAILCLLVIAAFFSVAEAALSVTSRARLTELEKRGSQRATSALRLTEKPERTTGALLLGRSLATSIAAVILAFEMRVHFGQTALISAPFLAALLFLVFAIVLPKAYASANPEAMALAVSPIMRFTSAVLGPLVLSIERAVRAVLGLFGISENVESNIVTAHEELRGTIDLHVKEGAVVKKDRDMLGGILDLKDLEVADVMVHRTKMEMLDADMAMKDIVDYMMGNAHTRIPIWRESPENIIGVLHSKKLFQSLQKAGGNVAKLKLEDIVSDPWFVPDTRPLEDQLNAFLRRKTHFAIAVDEYGEVQGLITLEDVLEEIVGDIKDEFDSVATRARRARDGSMVIDASLPLRDLNRAFDWKLPDDEATTLAGLVIHEARTIPDEGQVFTFHGFRFEVLRKRKQQIILIRVAKTLDVSTTPGSVPS